ncbi:MAG: hypothetical protein U1D30_01585 [Planctomycetota bacterium]
MFPLFRAFLLGLFVSGLCLPCLVRADEPKAEPKQEEKAKAEDGSTPVVKLTNPGTEPRRQLRYNFKKSTPYEAIMDMKMGSAVQINENKLPPQKMPTTRMAMTIEPKEVKEDGTLTYSFAFTEISILEDEPLPPAIRERMSVEMNKLTGLKGTATVNSRGITESVDFELPANATPQMTQMMQSIRQSMGRMSNPLPDEPVGLGGAWETDQSFNTNGINAQQKVTTSIESLDETSCKLALELKQHADKQAINSPNAPAGTSITLESMEGSGKGLMQLEFASVVPDSQVSLVTQTQMSFEQAGMTQSMKMTMDMDMKIYRKMEKK